MHSISAGHVPQKNITGNLGPRCNFCSGLGFTNSIKGGSHKCDRCLGTGIEPTDAKQASASVQQQIDDLREIVLELVQIVKKTE